MAPDITYRRTCSLFVAFYPETEAGQAAWRELAAHNDGSGKVLAIQLPDMLRRFRKAGYVVAKAKPVRFTDAECDAILAALMA